jgi:hypothetical protein
MGEILMTKKATAPKTLADIQRTYERSGVTDVEGLRRDSEAFIDQTVGIDSKTIGLLGATWNFVAENIERDAWKHYTREEWAELEHAHVEKSTYTAPDLIDDLMTRMERGKLTQDEARAEIEAFRECEYRFCLNVYKGRSNQRFCCRDCKERNKKANQRFKSTGTYLPPSAYKETRDDTRERNYRKRERTVKTSVIEGKLAPFEAKREHGYKKDEKRRIYRGGTPVNRGTKARHNEENGCSVKSNLPDYLQDSPVVNNGVSISPADIEATDFL